ncbi:MAG TPA: IclR family transcriptional regulator [Planctomycetota bacterium]|nr:IclR family transcriptional regulator [Planctomycetota bacterium]
MERRKGVARRSAARYRAPALEKGLDILELLADRPEGLGQSEIARALSRTVGEIFRMLACLVERGYVAVRRPSDRYILTPKLFELSHRHAPYKRLLSEALPVMKDLAARLRQSCHLVVPHNGRGVVVAQTDGPHEMGFGVRAGSLVELCACAPGRVLLAFQEDGDRSRLLREAGFKSGTPDFDRALQNLLAVRARGFDESPCSRVRGVHEWAFPIFDHRGAAAAALTVPYIERLDGDGPGIDAVRSALLEAARYLSTATGGASTGGHS